MRILIDLTSLADNFSGIERYAVCLTKEMIRDKSNEYVLVFKEEIHPIFREFIKNDNIEMLIFPRCNKLFFNQVRLLNAIKKIKADYYLFLAFPVPVLLFKKNMVSTIHDICCWDCPETMNGMSKWYFKISHLVAIRKCKAIITISEFSKNRIIEKLHYNPKKVWIVYCGVDEKFLNYKPDKIKEDKVKNKYNLPDEYILSLSTLEPRKNIPLLISAYSKLINDGESIPPLVLAGRKGWKMDQLLESIDDNIRKHILFTDFVEDEDLPYVYAASKLFVFPSKYEGFGMPPLEALACGVRVLSSDSSSLPEVLGNSVSYFENGNVNDLKEKLLIECNKNVINNNISIEQQFTWNYNSKILSNYIMGTFKNEN